MLVNQLHQEKPSVRENDGAKSLTKPTINDWLEDIDITQVDSDLPEISTPAIEYLNGWYGVSVANEGGFIAYFRDGVDAFRFRLDYINRKLNP